MRLGRAARHTKSVDSKAFTNSSSKSNCKLRTCPAKLNVVVEQRTAPCLRDAHDTPQDHARCQISLATVIRLVQLIWSTCPSHVHCSTRIILKADTATAPKPRLAKNSKCLLANR